MFDVFFRVYQLHQMLWYLIEASTIILAKALRPNIHALILENIHMTQHSPDEIMALDIDNYKSRVNQTLKRIGALVSPSSSNAGPVKAIDTIG